MTYRCKSCNGTFMTDSNNNIEEIFYSEDGLKIFIELNLEEPKMDIVFNNSKMYSGPLKWFFPSDIISLKHRCKNLQVYL